MYLLNFFDNPVYQKNLIKVNKNIKQNNYQKNKYKD